MAGDESSTSRPDGSRAATDAAYSILRTYGLIFPEPPGK
jgi:hypothetical protein